MSKIEAKASHYFDFLLSAKKVADNEINKTERLQSLKDKKVQKYDNSLGKCNANRFILENREILFGIVHDLYKKTFQEENEGKRAKYISLARMLLSAIQKNKTAKDFCFILETTPALQDMKSYLNVSGVNAVELLMSGYQLETSLSSLKLSGDRVIEIFSGLGVGNKKVNRIEFKKGINDLMELPLFYKGSKRDDDIDFSSLQSFMDSLKNGSITRLDGKAKTLLLTIKNNVLYKKEFELNDNEDIEQFLKQEENSNQWDVYDITFSELNKIIENIVFSIIDKH
nr:hypothetical protein [uncultured Halomonas sp.]